MRVHSEEKIRRVKSLRREGHSINEIVAELSVPKTTVWHHIRRVKVLPRYELQLRSKRGGSAKRSLERKKLAKKKARELMLGPDRERVIALAMLYWGEGHKKRSCEFINSDGTMIRFYLKILHEVFEIPNEQLKPTMRIFDGMRTDECLNYWAKVTEMPASCFKIRKNDGGTRGRTKYGMCRITVRKGGQTLKLFHALIDQIKREL